MILQQLTLTLIELDFTVLRPDARPRRDRGWERLWIGPLWMTPGWLPPPGSEVIDRIRRRGGREWREVWVRPRRRRRRSSGS